MAVLFKKIYEDSSILYGPSSIQVGRMVYHFGGYSATWQNTVLAYDITLNTYTALANIPIKCTPSILGEYNGVIYIVVGNSGVYDYNCYLYAYTIATNAWTKKSSYPTSRMMNIGSSVLYNGYFYTFGFWDGDNNRDVYQVCKYYISSDSWSTVGTLPSILQDTSNASHWISNIRLLTSSPVGKYIYFCNQKNGIHYRYDISTNTATQAFTNTVITTGIRTNNLPYLDSSNIILMVATTDTSKPNTAMADYYLFNTTNLTYTLIKARIDIPVSSSIMAIYGTTKYICSTGKLILSTGYGNSCRNVYLFDEFFPLIRYWTGAEWKECENVYIWNGSQWIEADNIYVWNGSSYVENS